MLLQRIFSALLMIPLALGAIVWGSYPFAAMVAAGGAIMVWEWDRMTGGQFTTGGRIAAALVAAAAFVTVIWPVAALALVLVGSVIAARHAEKEGKGLRFWALGGVLYCGVPVVALVWLRSSHEGQGLFLVLFLMLVVWATDIGAYAAGRTIGGPLLMPKVSPKKTWAGLIGGMLCAAVIGILGGMVMQLTPWATLNWAYPLGAAILAVVAQAGDLFESWVKRRWGVKDSSNIIPGHGGVLDRVDGVLSVAVFIAVLRLAGVI